MNKHDDFIYICMYIINECKSRIFINIIIICLLTFACWKTRTRIEASDSRFKFKNKNKTTNEIKSRIKLKDDRSKYRKFRFMQYT